MDEPGLAGSASRGIYFPLAGGGLLVAAAVIGLGISLYREAARESREAQSRVNFVNQVSHELKTPLTNIRRYADLLDGDLTETLAEPEAEQARERLGVIVAESHRLSRLTQASAPPSFLMGDLEVWPAELRARRGDDVIDLSLRDVKVLELLCHH